LGSNGSDRLDVRDHRAGDSVCVREGDVALVVIEPLERASSLQPSSHSIVLDESDLRANTVGACCEATSLRAFADHARGFTATKASPGSRNDRMVT
jgi:hypothetical protein